MKLKNSKNEARAVFEILVRENASMLTAYLRTAVKGETTADDLFQETMLTAWKRLLDYDRSRPFGPWLRGIASKLIMAHFRKARNDLMLSDSATLEYLSQQIQYINERPGDIWEEKIEALTHCIKALPDQQRQAIKLRYFECKTTEQMVQVTKDSLEAIRKRLQRSRIKLLDCLKRKNIVLEVKT